jgi:hypothetical protein
LVKTIFILAFNTKKVGSSIFHVCWSMQKFCLQNFYIVSFSHYFSLFSAAVTNLFFNAEAVFLGVGWDWVHLVRQPLTGLLYQPRMIDVDECGAVGGMRVGRGNRVIGENLPQSHFVHHKPHMTWPGVELGPPPWKAGD